MKILLFAGAGTSVELGVPSMTGLASEFLEHSHQWGIEPDLVQSIIGNKLDVEHLIEELDRICSALPSLESIGHDTTGLDSAKKVRAEVEWFVQHAAERVAARDAQLMWGSVLNETKNNQISFVTTNYDRAIELAANAEEIYLDDGFGPFTEGETSQWEDFKRESQKPLLIKLHGSTDWFTVKGTGHPTKLRHPMPLFGQSLLYFEGLELDSALVLPSREKMLTGMPYPRLSKTFLDVADCCGLALIVGSSLRDDHIKHAAQSVANKGISVFIVNPDGNDYGVENANVISQHASTFLVSTLPNALNASDPEIVLRKALGSSNRKERDILNSVKNLLDTKMHTRQRCLAVEELNSMEATLAPYLISQILNDSDPTVARYVLGLIPPSTSDKNLIDTATQSIHMSEPAFREELELLQRMVK